MSRDKAENGSIDDLLNRLNKMYGANGNPVSSPFDVPEKSGKSGEEDPELREMLEQVIAGGHADPTDKTPTITETDLPEELTETYPAVEPTTDEMVTVVSAEEERFHETVEERIAQSVLDVVKDIPTGPIAEPSEEPAIDEPAMEEPIAGEPVPEELTIEEPVAESTADSVESETEESTTNELVWEERSDEVAPWDDLPEESSNAEETADEPVTEEPAIEEPVIDEPAMEEPVIEETVTEEPVIETSETAEPETDEPVSSNVDPSVADSPEDDGVAIRFAEEGIHAQEVIRLAECENDEADASAVISPVVPDDQVEDDPEQFRIDSLLEAIGRNEHLGESVPPVVGKEPEPRPAAAKPVDHSLLPEEFRDGRTLTDDDIRMLLNLGYEKELAGLIGYDRIDLIRREGPGAPPVSRRKKRHRPKKPVLTGNLTEYTDRDQNFEVRARFAERRKHLYIRFCGTLFFALLLFVYDMPGLLGIPGFGVLNPEKLPGLYAFFGLQLLMLSAVLSYRQIWRGIRRASAFEADLYFIPIMLILFNAVYDILLLVFGKTGAPDLFHFVTVLFLLFAIGGELFLLAREELTFDTISGSGDRYTLEHMGFNESDGNVYHVRKTGFLSGVLLRTRTEEPLRILSILSYAAILFSLLMAAGSYILSGVITDMLSVFMKSVLFTVPLASCAAFTLPQFFVTQTLHERGCAVIGDASVSEYAAEKTVVFREEDIFKAGSKIGFSASGKQKLADQFRLTGILLRRVGGTLGSVLDLSQMEGSFREKAEVTEVGEDGLCATVGSSIAVMGSASYLTSHGIYVPAESAERIYLRKSDCVPLYIAFNGELCLEMEMTYRIGEVTEQMIHDLAVTGTRVGVNVCDPCLTAPFVWKLRRLEPDHIKIYRMTHVEGDESFRSIDGGISARTAGDLVYPLTACSRLSLMRRAVTVILCIASGVSALFMAALLAAGAVGFLSVPVIVLYQLIWHVPVLLASGVQFKHKETKK